MNKTTKRIGLILFIILLLPTTVFVINEIISLDNNEKIIKQIYTDQLETILFSVNQYSEDVVSNWAKRINEFLDEQGSSGFNSPGKVDSLYDEFPSLLMICIADSINDNSLEVIKPGNKPNTLQSNNQQVIPVIKNILKKNEPALKRLITYQKNGYSKLEPFQTDTLPKVALLSFVDSYSASQNKIICLVIDPLIFIQSILSSKIQEVTGSGFVISVTNPNVKFQYNSNLENSVKEVQQQRPLWIFPEFKIGISLKGKTIDDLVRERVTSNIILIGLVTLVLFAGGWIIFRNIKKEIELAQIKTDFVSNVSHELRTPLSLISMFSETLELGRVKSEEKKKEYYSIISQETNRLGRIVNSILSFSKMEAGKRQFNLTDAYINDIVETVYRSYKFHLEEKGFAFNFEKNETIPILKIDEEAISEALVNLVDNAVKYSDQQKIITVRTGKSEEYAFIEVDDKGIGIPQKDQKKIFEKFFRVSSGNIHNVKGSGLGLSIVKHIMDAHRGKIELFSEVNNGSRFRLIFPLSN
jgi:signal transduction histidine kinase